MHKHFTINYGVVTWCAPRRLFKRTHMAILGREYAVFMQRVGGVTGHAADGAEIAEGVRRVVQYARLIRGKNA